MPVFVARSEIRLIRMRGLRILSVMESKPAFGADSFRKFAAVAQINHGRGPGRRESAFILDRELDLQVLVLVIGIIRSAGPSVLFCTALHRVFGVIVA